MFTKFRSSEKSLKDEHTQVPSSDINEEALKSLVVAILVSVV